MVTLTKYTRIGGGEIYNRNVLWIEGLSSESKPTTTFVEYDSNGKEVGHMPIENGSIYSEIDTGKTYKYDVANAAWYEFGDVSEITDVIAGIDHTENNYIEMKNGVRLYISATAPTGARTGDLWIGG